MSINFGQDGSTQHIAANHGKILQVQQTIKRDTASYYLSSSGTSMDYSSVIMSRSITPSNSKKLNQ